MTKVEAIKFGTAWLGIQEKLEGCEMYEFFKMSVKALQEEPCDDCVRRQEVLDILKDEWNKFSDANDAMQESIDTIEALKPVTPKQEPKSEWQHDHEILKAYSDGANDVLDKIRAEIEHTTSRYCVSRERGGSGIVVWSDRLIKESEVLKIIDKYKAGEE